MNLGNSLWETTTFNSRLQPVDMQLGTSQGDSSLWQLHMSYSSASITGNNGNVMQQVISAPGLSLTQAYTYDGGNRLHLAAENPTNMTTPACPDAGSHWCETFDYDNWGNRLVTARSVLGVSPLEPTSFDAANHITTTGWSYESSRTGNISTDPLNRTMAYDGENRMVAICTQDPSSCVNAAGAGRTLYRYDGDGKRVEKLPADGSKTIYVYDASGLLAAEYVTPASGSGGTEYVTTDQLGSTRVVTSGSGAVLERRDYLPFGEDLLATAANGRVGVTGYGGNAGISQKFTGKERDAETGLDYFGARYFSGAQGRFTSPDPKQFPHGITDPQSWNKYAYTRNNPLRYVDPDGEDWQDYLKGAINAFTSNNTGVGRISSGNGDFKTGQAIGDAISTVTGALETVIGSGGEVLGVGLDATGAGAVLGVPLNVASAGLIVHGGTTAVVSSVHLAQDVNEATSSGQPYENTPQNQERMSQGKAPVGKDGKAVELHHEGQASEGNLKEMTQSEHRGGENFSKNHPNTGQQPSQIDRSKFKQQREQYWKDKAKKPDQQ